MHKRGTGDPKREREKLSEMYVYTRSFLWNKECYLFFECSWLLFIVSYPVQVSYCEFIPTHSLQISCNVRKLFLATTIILMKRTQWYLLQEQKTQYLHFKGTNRNWWRERKTERFLVCYSQQCHWNWFSDNNM